MSRSGNYSMLTQTQQRLKNEGKDANNISLLSRETGLCRDTIRKYLKDGVPFIKQKVSVKNAIWMLTQSI